MVTYDESGEGPYYDDSVGSFEQDLVYALDSGVRHTVNVALAKAIQPIEQHLFDFTEQQGSISGNLSSGSEVPSVLQGFAGSISDNPHVADFEQFVRTLAKDHEYSSSTTAPKASTQGDSGCSSSSSRSPDQGDASIPCKSTKKSCQFQVALDAPKVLIFDPEDIIHPRSSSWTPPSEVAEYIQTHICHGFDKEIRSRLRSEWPRPDLPSKLDPTLVTYLK
ncbi:hypothetical protein NDU88_012843 [Pleurodeles waltl]|uniref:Uncharacterized protein n=1 Tax=Pleurodeles waltl TaxID=8319 RepID=A0AAV7R1D8_PLEWA|nr:hypothetical protein NDU88_012843 [Pleurodeles waltl]